ncbi:MAG: SpoIIE family protein phosphatase [Candidatus Eisenbacteria sp.]|nr:SpoIIE family protein phosphatase [Candidatus Eisenbacteria bacterium]
MADKNTGDSRLESLDQENRRLKRAVEELTILNDLAREIGASTNSQKIMNTIIRRALRAVRAEQGVITLVDRKSSTPMRTLVRTMISSADSRPFHLDQSILGWMILNKKPLMVNDPPVDDRFRGVRWDESIQTLLAAPLLVKSELIGVLTLYNKKEEDGGFAEEDQRLLAIIATQSGQVVENARLYEEEQALFRMKEELRLASGIQHRLLPKTSPQVSGYDIAGVSIPTEAVGGDYFDFMLLDGGRLAFCLGDVSGKGLPAALLMSNLQATVRGQAPLAHCPKECIERANRLLFGSTEPDRFASLFYGILNPHNHDLCYCSAGHEQPFLIRKGAEPSRLEAGGMLLSFLEEVSYEEACVSLDPGDVLVIYSDGITDALNGLDEAYGEPRLLDLIQNSMEESAADLMGRIIREVREHAGDRPQFDDMTLVVIRREVSET